MPGFVKTPKDEEKWKKAKEAAGKQTEVDSESYYKLANYIYHNMGKTEEDKKIAEIYKSEIYRSFESQNQLSVQNLKNFLMNNSDIQQSYNSNEVSNMSDKKIYSAKDAAHAVLKKVGELLKESSLAKAEKGVHAPANTFQRAAAGRSVAGNEVRSPGGSPAHAKALHSQKLAELKSMPKPNLPKSEAGMAEKEMIQPEGVQSQIAPENNPKEQIEGNNEPWGTAPGVKGHYKLAKFCGHMEAKRKMKAPGVI
jgi:hypothetical protein